MTTYYVSTTGSNSNTGLSPAQSWLTVTKALSSGAGPTGGDTVYLAPGIYRETVAAALTSPSSELKIVGDVTGQFHGVTGGEVRITAYTTNDSTTPTNVTLLNYGTKSNLTFENIVFVGGNTNPCVVLGSTGQNITFRKCQFVAPIMGPNMIYVSLSTQNLPANLLVEQCIFFGNDATSLRVDAATSTIADWDIGITIRNCIFNGARLLGANINATGANSFKPGGVLLQNCTAYTGASFAFTNNANSATSIPCKVYNCIVGSANSNCLSANTLGQIVEDYNLLHAYTPRNNVAVGTNSTTDFSKYLNYEMGQSVLIGAFSNPPFTPVAGSPILGFGNSGAVTALTTDFTGKSRPAGGGSTSNSIGALERHNTAAKETSTVRTGSSAINIIGPGDQEFNLPVDAIATTVSVYARYDTNHAATNKPQMMVTNGGECGVSDATATMTAAVDTWQQISLTFTPSAKGIVTIRVLSRAAASTGKAFFDDFVVS